MTDGNPIIWGDPSKDHRTLVYRDGTGVDREVTEGFEMYDVNGRWMTILGLSALTPAQLRVSYSNGIRDTFGSSMFSGLRWAWTAPRKPSDPGTGRLRQRCMVNVECERPAHVAHGLSGFCSTTWDAFVGDDQEARELVLDHQHGKAAEMNPVMRVDHAGQRWVLRHEGRPVMVGDVLESRSGGLWATWRGAPSGGLVKATPVDERPTTFDGALAVELHDFPGVAWARELH